MQKLKINDFDTIIFDLDFTIWKGSKKDFWAKSLIFPIVKKRTRLYDSNNDYIQLFYGTKTFLQKLHTANKNIGFSTRGGLLNIDYDQQPCILALRQFDILQYFNYKQDILYKTDLKSKSMIAKGKTLFIDDNIIDLNDVRNNCPLITVLDRTTITTWNELL